MRLHAILCVATLIHSSLILVCALSVPNKVTNTIKTINNKNILHPLAIQADLLRLNATVNSLIGNSTSKNADLLLQKARKLQNFTSNYTYFDQMAQFAGY